MKPISRSPPPYFTSSSSLALPASGLVADRVSVPFLRLSFTARDFSLEMVETRSTASANSRFGTSITLSFPVGMTR